MKTQEGPPFNRYIELAIHLLSQRITTEHLRKSQFVKKGKFVPLQKQVFLTCRRKSHYIYQHNRKMCASSFYRNSCNSSILGHLSSIYCTINLTIEL